MVRDIINNLEINFVDINKEIFDKENPWSFPWIIWSYNSKGYEDRRIYLFYKLNK